jgi:hypothetical protein
VTRTCPDGKVALSGGFLIGGAASAIALYGSYPYDGLGSFTPLGWTFRAFEVISSEDNWSLFGDLICADTDALLFQAAPSATSADEFRGGALFCPAGYVATAGGAQHAGLRLDWITSTHPSSLSREAWSLRLQRLSGETEPTSHTYAVICPEPGASALAALAIASVIGLGWQRRDSDAPSASPQ